MAQDAANEHALPRRLIIKYKAGVKELQTWQKTMVKIMKRGTRPTKNLPDGTRMTKKSEKAMRLCKTKKKLKKAKAKNRTHGKEGQ